jgi:gluconolactonase
MEGILVPRQPPSNYDRGRVERVDLSSGAVEVLYEECDGRPLRAPNDLVFDTHGGFYFTDHGIREHRVADRTGVFYAQPDGSAVREVIPPLDAPNGVGLSPDGSRIYVAETYSACVWWWNVTGPGEVSIPEGLLPHGGELLTRLPGFQFLDSLAVDAEGNVCVATLGSGGITSISPEDGSVVEFFEGGDLFVTNICFGGEDLRTAYVTLSGAGKLLEVSWPRPGLRLAHYA